MAGALTALLASPPALTAEPLDIALQSFPPARGDPFAVQIVPTVIVLTPIFDSLTEFASNGALNPSLALSWERQNGNVWRFKLRPAVSFSNGEPFDAAAVEAAFAHLKTPEGKTTRGAQLFNNVASVRVVDPLTIDIGTTAPDPVLPRRMSAFRVPAPKKLAELGIVKFAREPAGTGPFKVDRWTDTNLALSAAPNAWRKPASPAINMRLIPEATARLQALLSGAADIAYALDPEGESALKDAGGRLIVEESASNLVVALLSTSDAPVKDVRVRQALNYAVNKQAMVDGLLGGRSIVASQPVPITVPGADPDLKPYEYSPEKAKQLLAEAGYPNGFKMTMELSASSGSNSQSVFQMIASDLAKVGIQATVRTLPNTETLRRILQGGWEGHAFEMTQDAMPALDPMAPFRYTSCSWPAPWYCDPAATPLIKAAEEELDEAKRAEMVRALMRRYREAAPMIYLFRIANFTGLSAGVKDYDSPFGLVSYLRVHKN